MAGTVLATGGYIYTMLSGCGKKKGSGFIYLFFGWIFYFLAGKKGMHFSPGVSKKSSSCILMMGSGDDIYQGGETGGLSCCDRILNIQKGVAKAAEE